MPVPPLTHPRTAAQLAAITPTWSGSYLFHGARAIGKATAARAVARQLNCQGDDGANLCAACRQFDAGTYPDLITIRPEDKPSITIEQIRTLVQALSLRPYYDHGLRIIIIDDAECLTAEAQNALLKLIEEPPPRTMIMLITERLEALLSTVRSRCAAVYFARPTEADLATYLATSRNLKPVTAASLAAAAEGLPGIAIALADQPAVAATRQELDQLAAAAPAMTVFKRLLTAKQLIDTKADLHRFGRRLQATIVAGLREGQADAAQAADQLRALELYRAQLQAKVSPRVAVERLMLEL